MIVVRQTLSKKYNVGIETIAKKYLSKLRGRFVHQLIKKVTETMSKRNQPGKYWRSAKKFKKEMIKNIPSEKESFSLEELGFHPRFIKNQVPNNILQIITIIYNDELPSAQPLEGSLEPHWSEIPVTELIHDIRHTFYILRDWFSPFLYNTDEREKIPLELIETFLKPKYWHFGHTLEQEPPLQSLFLWAVYEIIVEENRSSFVESIIKPWKETINCFKDAAFHAFNGLYCNIWTKITKWIQMPSDFDFLNSLQHEKVEDLKCIKPRDMELLRKATLEATTTKNKCRCCVNFFEAKLADVHLDSKFSVNFADGLTHFGPKGPDAEDFYSEKNEDNTSDQSEVKKSPPYQDITGKDDCNDPKTMSLGQFAYRYTKIYVKPDQKMSTTFC